MNIDQKLNNSFFSDLTSIPEERSNSLISSSLYLPNFQSVPNHFICLNTPEECSIGSEQTFRQSRVPSPSKEVSRRSSIDNKPKVMSSSKKERSFSRDQSTHDNSRTYTFMNFSPLKKKITSEVATKSTSYLPLAERLCLVKEELGEKIRELQDVKSVNGKLLSEVKSYREKENHKSIEIEDKLRRFNVEPNKMKANDLSQKYQELLGAYKQLLSHNMQIEESFRLETLRAEEQRAYIEVLKQKLGLEGFSDSQLNGNNEEKEEHENEVRELEQRIADLLESESSLKTALENLRGEFREIVAEKEMLSHQVDNCNGEMMRKQEEVERLTSENIHLANENRRLSEQLSGSTKLASEKMQAETKELREKKEKAEEKLEKERENLLETLREREVMINDLTQENSKLSQEVLRCSKALSEFGKQVGEKMKNYEEMKNRYSSMKKELEKEKRRIVDLECEVKAREEKIKEASNENSKLKKVLGDQSIVKTSNRQREELSEDVGNMKEEARGYRGERRKESMGRGDRENGGQENREESEVILENKSLQKKVHILADRVADLKEFEKKCGELSEYMGNVEKELNKVLDMCEGKGTEEQRGKAGSGSRSSGKELFRRIMSYMDVLVEKIGKSERHPHLNEGEQKSVRETSKIKEEMEKLQEKVKVLSREKELLVETEEKLYRRLSKAETETESLKERMEDRILNFNDMEARRQEKMRSGEMVEVLQEEIKLKQEEIDKLKGFVFDEEVKELIEEGVQVLKEMLKLDKILEQNNRREETDRKLKRELESMKAKKKALEEELYAVWSREKKKYESLSKLEHQNFQLQNEVSRLMNELEINFSKYDGDTSNYYSYKQNEKLTQVRPLPRRSSIEGIQRKGEENGGDRQRNQGNLAYYPRKMSDVNIVREIYVENSPYPSQNSSINVSYDLDYVQPRRRRSESKERLF